MAAQRRFARPLASPRLHDAGEPRPPAPDRERERFVASLRQAAIATIAGPELVQAMKGHDPLPPFPRGGTDRSLLAGARVNARLVEAIARSLRRDVGELAIDPPQWRAPPTGSDADLACLLNLWRPPVDYPTGSASHRGTQHPPDRCRRELPRPDPRSDRRVCPVGPSRTRTSTTIWGGSIGWCAVDILFIVRSSSGATRSISRRYYSSR
jgi:hypothetical protein